MNRIRAALAVAPVLALLLSSAQRADAGPIKHWGTFPGREVRAIAFRGNEMGAEPYLAVIPGRDGYIYLRGKGTLYRVLDANGRYERIPTPASCPFGTVDASMWVPGVICEREAERSKLPRPSWRDDRDPYASDYHILTHSVRLPNGSLWFAYGYARGLGYRDAAGRTVLRRISGLAVVRGVKVFGDDVYLTDDACTVTHLRRFVVVDMQRFGCNGSVGMVTVRDSLWIARDGELVRIGRGGNRTHVRLPFYPMSIAADRHGTTYVLGSMGDRQHPAIATIDARGRVETRILPMQYADSLVIDRRDRIWIGVSWWRAFAVVAPKGAWG
ncbi:MAG TPA: hypothetical protein VGX96_20575 [Candidatus Elarobacter sp.]|jgi:hypothetical protein|nr:hypothetical protein [Candidatus Elarobacter sp.]